MEDNAYMLWVFREVLQHIGEDPEREGLVETPERILKAWEEIFAGYRQRPEELFKVFEDGACDQMVICKDIEFFSMCEHHMLPFFGRAHVGYIPAGKVIGVSKLARLVDCFAKRLQIQERLTQQVVDSLDSHLQPAGAICVIEAAHLCMKSRGVKKYGTSMITSAISGVFRQSEVRSEFFSLVGLK